MRMRCSTTMSVDTSLLFYCFYHFHGLDHSNAAVHCAEVRYSPITFRLAEAISEAGYQCEDPDVEDVMSHKGVYMEDKGR